MHPTKSKQQVESLLAEIRLVVGASLPDEELELKAEAVEQELEAIDKALADEGTYLGIVDKGELDKRKELLERKLTLLKQERDYLHALNVALREEDQILAAAEPAELLASSPEQRDSSKNAVETAEHSSSSSVGAPAGFPSPQSTAHPNPYSFSLPSAAEFGIDDFLMKNAAVGILSGSAPGATKSATTAQILGRDTRGRGSHRDYDREVDEDLT